MFAEFAGNDCVDSTCVRGSPRFRESGLRNYTIILLCICSDERGVFVMRDSSPGEGSGPYPIGHHPRLDLRRGAQRVDHQVGGQCSLLRARGSNWPC